MRGGLGVLMAGLGLAALLTGCTGAPPSTAPTAPTAADVAPSPSIPVSASATGSPSASAPAPATTKASAVRTDPDAPEGQCADSALRLDLRETGGGLGSRQDLIVFRNTGSTPCTLAGAPGVSVVGEGRGTQLGQPAGPGTGAAKAVVLQPGAAVTAQLSRTYVDGSTTTFRGEDGPIACRPEHGDGYRIYPPHSYRAVFVEHDVWACTTGFVWMRIDPVVAGR